MAGGVGTWWLRSRLIDTREGYDSDFAVTAATSVAVFPFHLILFLSPSQCRHDFQVIAEHLPLPLPVVLLIVR